MGQRPEHDSVIAMGVILLGEHVELPGRVFPDWPKQRHHHQHGALCDRKELLGEIDGVAVRDLGEVKGGIVTFEVDGRNSLEIRELLSERSINVSISTPLSAPIDMHERGIDDLVRASFHAFNTEEEIEQLVSAIQVLS